MSPIEPASGRKPLGTALGRSPTAYAWYVLAVLSLANFFNNLDRYYFSVALQAIKKDLHASDTQMSLLVGLAFAALHGVACIPIARLSDRTVRRNILGIALAIWSAATAACGLAANFVTMAIARAGVGVGEAGGVPPSLSILSDYFDRHRRPMAMGLFYSANALALCVGLPLVGLLVELHGWRSAFYVLGLAGLLFAPIILFTVREPRRGATDEADEAASSRPRPSVTTCLRLMAANRPFMLMLLSQLIVQTAVSANSAWFASFFIRYYHLTYPEVAALNGIPFGVAGTLGAVAGGMLTTRLVQRTGDEQWMARVPALAALVAGPFALIGYCGGSFMLAAVFGVLIYVCIAFRQGISFAVAMDYMPQEIRTLTAAMVLIVQSVIGGTLGPLLVGMTSDRLAPALGEAEGLRIAMMIVVPSAMILGGLLGFQKVGRRSTLPAD